MRNAKSSRSGIDRRHSGLKEKSLHRTDEASNVGFPPKADMLFSMKFNSMQNRWSITVADVGLGAGVAGEHGCSGYGTGRVGAGCADRLSGDRRKLEKDFDPGRVRYGRWTSLAPTVGAAILMLVFLAVGPEVVSTTPSYYEPYFVTLEIAAGLIGWKVGENLGLKRNYQRFFDGLRKRGAPETVPTRFSISPTGLRATSERGTFVAAWPSILEIFATEAHWLVQSDGFTMALPRRAFSSPEKENAFIAKLVSSLSAEARQRSASALTPLGLQSD